MTVTELSEVHTALNYSSTVIVSSNPIRDNDIGYAGNVYFELL